MNTTSTETTTPSTANRMGRNPFAQPTSPATPKARVLKTETRTTPASVTTWTFSQLVRFVTVTVPVGTLAIGLDLLRERLTSTR